MNRKMEAEQFIVRLSGPDEDPAIAALVVEGFLDKFRPVFGKRMDRSVRIMEKWIRLEHASGGVTTLVIEGYSTSELAGSVGFPRAVWATTLLSYPRYSATSSEAYVERLVVSPDFRRQGMARRLLAAAEDLARDEGKKTVGLHVSGNNLPALRLYENEGYEEVSRQHSFLSGYFLNIKYWLYLKKEL